MHGTHPPNQRFLELIRLDDPRWARFVAGHAERTPFHEPAWARLLAECYGLSGGALAAIDASGAVCAGLPVLSPPWLPGRPRRLVSLPFTDAIAPLVPAGEERWLAAALADARERMGLARIELRGNLDGAAPVGTGAVVHTLDLVSDADAVAAGFSKSARRNIRLAERRGVVIRRATEERDLTDVFFGLHLATRQRLGVPVQPKRFFDRLWKELTRSSLGFVLVAEQEGRPVASAVFLRAAGTVVYKYSASDAASRSSKPNDLLIATAIRHACESGCSRFDFGRSDVVTEGLRAFKRGFGAEESALTYSVVGQPAASAGRGESGIMQRVLQRSPAWATRLAGEMLYRYAA